MKWGGGEEFCFLLQIIEFYGFILILIFEDFLILFFMKSPRDQEIVSWWGGGKEFCVLTSNYLVPWISFHLNFQRFFKL